uniref:Uncharacterized protein n=1 Tax=Hemiselmis tepida TaxID=464990 RepID=A0A7S0VEV8_9CRYP|mmetsp:Transcript_15949/g.40458  ORF Transcript_15949/g.40458 Transcript_15949/m.40458 type:complete len:395 (+) Transcript_15949:158-1342(+)
MQEPHVQNTLRGDSGPLHVKPGQTMTWQASRDYAAEMGGRLLTLDEARAFIGGRALYSGEDTWVAVEPRDWMQVGDNPPHHPGKSHNMECGGYPVWGDDATQTGARVVLYTKMGTTNPDAPECVTVQMSADDWIDEIFYNGVSIRHLVSNASAPTNNLKVFSFDAVPGGVLAIAANDIQGGNSASFFMKCTSTNPHSGCWNFQIQPGFPSCKSFGTGGVSGGAGGGEEDVGSMGRPAHLNPPHGWEKNDFNDAHWQAPTVETDTSRVWQAKFGMAPGVWHEKHKYTFYRIRPAPAEHKYTGGLIATKDIAGYWIGCCPCCCCWLLKKESTGPNSLKHTGFACLLLPIKLAERTRILGTNRFVNDGEPHDLLYDVKYKSPTCATGTRGAHLMKLC